MTLVCSEPGCPLATDGRCLESVEDPRECPHTTEVADEPGENGGVAEAEELVEPADEAEEMAEVETIDLGGDQSLSISEAEPVAARYGATVVVVVGGAFESGKTSIVAGLYGLFLEKEVAGWSFAGSNCLVALDARYHGKRASSGLSEPASARTRDEDMRLLDLRLARAGRVVNLMFSDVRGEYFEAVVGGQPVAEAVSLAARADLAIVLLDGKRLADPYGRAREVTFGRQLIAGVTEPGGARAGLPLALVVSKVDELADEQQAWVDEQLEVLGQVAVERGFASVERHLTAAFAKAEADEHQGMPGLLEWLVADRMPPRTVPEPAGPPGLRSYLRGRSGG
jgi:hypothetical protein